MKYCIHIIFILIYLTQTINAQNNKYEDDIPFERINGKIVLNIKIDRRQAKFIVSTTEEMPTTIYNSYLSTNNLNPVNGKIILKRIEISPSVFLPEVAFNVSSNEDLESLGIAGVLGFDIFSNYVITFNEKDKLITLSAPYKPSYVTLKNRTNLIENNQVEIRIEDKKLYASIDINSPSTLTISKKNRKAEDIRSFTFAGKSFSFSPSHSSGTSIGNDLLKEGLLSIDYGKKKVYFQPYESLKKDNNTPTPSLIKEGNIIHLDRILFTEKIFNYREKENWEYLGDKPAIIDFWAEWCGPCQKISPIIEELAEEYKGKADFYKLNIDD